VDAREALDVLGVPEGTDLAGVRAAYRGLVRAAHPDVAPGDDAHARTARLTEAYEVIVAFVERHGAPPAPAPDPPPGPAPPPGDDEPVVAVDAHGAPDEGTIVVAAAPGETYAALYEAAGRVGDIAYCDRRLGILEIIVRFEGGPSCSVVMMLSPRRDPGVPGRSRHTEVLCTIESIESTPAPPIAPVIGALVEELRAL
jgi:hypothetical protein